ncbi:MULTISPECIES: pYEATS domain-containing protein [unclassified Bradyrhizobium]|uniref:pYEATS domain-containing protein n=1 Tax=unclassified Bradyrhizobium TaxID=2631580 RepID=UPI001FFB12A6|nr:MULTISPECIES: pYEATS domain-containing protein [unclassified Bradyrhizobium]MCK1538675.1 hypothetical protein [Bradyrhizobium sp. 176]MCK1558617.1 hypothetical protein [Bradyrhizobium sp. 171]MCK1689578.1 hypothetical protein [Bradyrhizobium sp. 145]
MDTKGVGVALIQIIPGLLWPLLFFLFAFLLRDVFRPFVQALKIRLERGEALKFWLIELQKIALASGAQLPASGKFQVISIPDRQKEIEAEKQRIRNLMLVDVSFRDENSRSKKPEWSIVFFLAPHYGDLSVVDRVEYALDTGWGSSVFVSTDRTRGFAVKVGSYGSVLCSACIYFQDGTAISQTRYALVENT